MSIAETFRQLDSIKDGAFNGLNNETLLWLEDKLQLAKLHCQLVRERRTQIVQQAPAKMNLVERRAYLDSYVTKHGLNGKEEYTELENHAKALKAASFYSATSVNADIIHRLKDSIKRKQS